MADPTQKRIARLEEYLGPDFTLFNLECDELEALTDEERAELARHEGEPDGDQAEAAARRSFFGRGRHAG